MNLRKFREEFHITTVLNQIAYLFEIALAFAIIIGILTYFIQLAGNYFHIIATNTTLNFHEFLSNILNLIIGIEFTRMLCRHTADTIIEVLLFATARQMIIAHDSMSSLIGVLSVAILFCVRKYLMYDAKKVSHESFLKSLTLKKKKRACCPNATAQISPETLQEVTTEAEDEACTA